MESRIGQIFEHSSSNLRVLYIVNSVIDDCYITTKIMLYNDRDTRVCDCYHVSHTTLEEQISRGIIKQIHPNPPKMVKVKFCDGNTREVPIGSYIVQYFNAGEWQNIEAFPDTLEGNKSAQKLMEEWEWESQLIKLN